MPKEEKAAVTNPSTGLATFREITKKYPARDSKRVLLDLAELDGDSGHWFAAARGAGLLEFGRNTDAHGIERRIIQASRRESAIPFSHSCSIRSPISVKSGCSLM